MLVYESPHPIQRIRAEGETGQNTFAGTRTPFAVSRRHWRSEAIAGSNLSAFQKRFS